MANILFAGAALAQQNYVGRYDIYDGFAYLSSPHINLSERGFHFQIGVRPKTWLTVGFDYSVAGGHTDLTPALLPTALQQQLAGTLGQLAAAHLIPPNYVLDVPINSTTQNFAAGPQFPYRRWRAITPFIRPSFGAVHETAVPHPRDPVAAMISASLAPSGKKQDWTGFYGFGGGLDLNISGHYALRLQADFVHDHLFNDLLRDARNTVRVSIGPAIQFGRNVSR
jgi:hypothetical protein